MKINKLFFTVLALFTLGSCVDIPEPPYNLPTGEGGGTVEEGENLLTNSDLETWNNGEAEGWGLTVTNCKYSQSTDDVNSGNYAVVINGDASSNKRFASKSYTLKAGEYTLGAYLKKYGETLGQYRLGYAKLTNGKVADTQNDYNYITSATAVPTDWKRSTCTFTLDTDTEVAIIIMNSKYGEGAAILIDDITLTTTNGGLSDGTVDDNTKGNAYINETFATGLGNFTTVEKAGDFPWKFEEYNGKGYAKVSGFANGESQDAESWLISPTIDLSKETKAYISFSYVINKGDITAAASNHKVLITDNYTGNVSTTEWNTIDFNAVNDSTWTFKNTGKIELPTSMIGKEKVVIAFKYISTKATSSTWELNNLIVDGEVGAPAQKEEDNKEDKEEETAKDAYIHEALTSTLGSFTTQQKIGNYPWAIDTKYSCAKVTSYDDTQDSKYNEAESWLISSAVDFTNETEAYIAFEYIIRYAESGKVAENHQLKISSDYSGDVATTEWIDIAYNAKEGSDWNTFYKANVAVPTQFMGKKNVVFALCYKATNVRSSTWEVKNFIVAKGKASGSTEEPETPENPDIPTEAVEYTVTEAIAAYIAGKKIPAIVTGYIVGFVDGTKYENCTFGIPTEKKSNILIADDANETDKEKCIPIELPSGNIRNALNLVDNPNNYKKKVALTGSLEKYFYVAGLKGVTKYEMKDSSEEPETPEKPDTTPDDSEDSEDTENTETPDSTPEEPEEDNYIKNAGFEEWSDGKPTFWGAVNGMSNNNIATVSKKEEPHSGSYSAVINGSSSQNKLFTSNSYTLPAGKYKLSAYIKQNGENLGKFRFGIWKLNNGSIDGNIDYLIETSSAGETWKQFVGEKDIEFTETTEITVVIMNSKTGKGASILVDDVKLIKID